KRERDARMVLHSLSSGRPENPEPHAHPHQHTHTHTLWPSQSARYHRCYLPPGALCPQGRALIRRHLSSQSPSNSTTACHPHTHTQTHTYTLKYATRSVLIL